MCQNGQIPNISSKIWSSSDLSIKNMLIQMQKLAHQRLQKDHDLLDVFSNYTCKLT